MKKKHAPIFFVILALSVSCSNTRGDVASIVTSSSDVKSFSHKFTFHKSNLVDGDPSTSWQVRTPRNGVGEWIEFKLKRSMNIKGLSFANGFQLVDPEYGDLYFLNSRLRKVRVCLNGGRCNEYFIQDQKTPAYLPIDAKNVENIRIVILDVYSGSRWANDLAVGEIEIVEAQSVALIILLAVVIAGAIAGGFIMLGRVKTGGSKEKSYEKIVEKVPRAAADSTEAGSFNAETYAMGKDFEHFIAKIFNRQKNVFTIEFWNFDVHNKHKDIQVESDRNPDFIIRHNESGARFGVECKFRSGTIELGDGNQAVEWSTPDQIKRYGDFSKEKNLPVFVVIGLGGKPKKPLVAFCVPLKEAHYPRLFMSLLSRFVRMPVNRAFEWRDGVLR